MWDRFPGSFRSTFILSLLRLGWRGQGRRSRANPAAESPPREERVNTTRAPNTFRMHGCHLSRLTTAPLSAIWVYYGTFFPPHNDVFLSACPLTLTLRNTAGEKKKECLFYYFWKKVKKKKCCTYSVIMLYPLGFYMFPIVYLCFDLMCFLWYLPDVRTG